MRSKECLDIDGKGLGNVHTWECVGDKDQIILFCEDGTMRNDLMNTCIQQTQNGASNVVSAPCNFATDLKRQ